MSRPVSAKYYMQTPLKGLAVDNLTIPPHDYAGVIQVNESLLRNTLIS